MSDDTARAAVLQVSSDDTAMIARATLQARHLLEVTGEVPVEIVVQGKAVGGLLAAHPAARALAEHLPSLPGVTVLVCANALAGLHLGAAQLTSDVQVVPSGAAHCAQRQWDGWAYLRV